MPRRPSLLLPLALLSAGCGGDWKPRPLLIDLADAHGALLENMVREIVPTESGADVEAYDGQSGEWSGTLTVPSDGENWGVDGQISMDASVVWTVDEFYAVHWIWDIGIDFHPWTLDDHELDGSASWQVESTREFDFTSMHTWAGTTSIDDDKDVEIAYTAHYMGNLHWVKGTVGGTEVDWENPNSDEP